MIHAKVTFVPKSVRLELVPDYLLFFKTEFCTLSNFLCVQPAFVTQNVFATTFFKTCLNRNSNFPH